MQRPSLPGARATSGSAATQRRSFLPSTSTNVVVTRHQQVRQLPPRLLSAKSTQSLQRPCRPLSLACSASSNNGSGGNGSSSSGSEKAKSKGIDDVDGSTTPRIPSTSSSSPLPVPEPLRPSTRIEADLGVGEFDAFKEVSRE